MTDNALYYGDNLDVMRRYIADESIDLVYLDPPFNSNATYNVLFAEKSGDQAAAQIKAFGDTWHWDQSAEQAYWDVLQRGGRPAEAIKAFRDLLGENDMMAYLAMMAPRLVELHRVLKATGSIYLHCDSTASHYLKVVMDSIFGVANFRNDIVWKRFNFHADARRYGRVYDDLLFYSKTSDLTWNPQYVPLEESYVKSHFGQVDESGRHFRLDNAMAEGQGPPRRFGDVELAPPAGTHWRWSQENIDRLVESGVIVMTSRGRPSVKRYLDEIEGAVVHAVWTDIPSINSQAKERLGYPTQKPVALLERIIKASSNPGDRILDPFCGCGTTIDASQRLDRRWIGIDITYLAISLIKSRLKDSYGDSVKYRIIGEPTALTDAEELAHDDPYQFQWWSLGLVDARPVEQTKGADKGIDGRVYFQDDAKGSTKQVIFSVKAGHVTVSQVRDLIGVLDREKAAIGVLISMEEPTHPMRTEAVTAGFYEWEWTHQKFPRVQLITVAELLDGRKVEMPPIRQVSTTFKRAPSRQKDVVVQPSLLMVAEEPTDYETEADDLSNDS